MDHDQRFKTLIREFFESFMRLFFADHAARIDFASVEWQDKELFPNPPQGERHVVDLLAKVRVVEAVNETQRREPEPWLICVHIEIESPDRTTQLKPRLPFYYFQIRERFGLPVLPIAIYLQVGLDGIGVDSVIETFGTWEVNRFQYLYVGLPGLDAVEYLEGENWLGVALAALMRIPPDRIAWLGAEALRRIAGSDLNTEQKYLLGECVEAYLALDEAESEKFQKLLLESKYQGVLAVNKTSYDRGLEKGLEKGELKGQVKTLNTFLEARFGVTNETILQHLMTLDPKQMHELTRKIATATKWEDLGIPR